MISRTKYELDADSVKKIFSAAGLGEVKELSPLGAGEYNAVYSVRTDRDYVIKIAPSPDTRVMTYEKDMMKAEIFWYGVIREKTNIRVPEIYYTDFGRKIIPSDYFIMEKLGGKQRNEAGLDRQTSAKLTAQTLAQIHKIGNSSYGYIQNGLYPDWYAALHSIIENAVKDSEAVGRRTKRGERLLAYAERYKDVLSSAPCSMVNYDLWDPNILCTTVGGKVEFAWIDPERSFWGDRIFDFICIDNPIDPLEKKQASIDLYNDAAQEKIRCCRETEIRYAFAQGLMGLIQETEKYYRYSPRRYGWWRNVLSGSIMYKAAFKTLSKYE